MKNQCEEYRSLMADAISTGLDAERNSELQRHLEACSACREHWRLLQRDDGRLTTLTEMMRLVVSGIESSTVNCLLGDAQAVSCPILPKRTFHVGVWVKCAAAIVLACFGALWVGRSFGPLRVSTVSLAQTLEAMRAMTWVHSVEVLSTEPTAAWERWECFGTHVVGCRRPDGVVEYTDYVANTAYRYNPNSNKITVSFTTDTYMLPRPQTAFEMLTQVIDGAQEVGAHMMSSPVVENGRNLERIVLMFDDYPHCESTVLLRDTRSHLLVRMETTEIRGDERPVRVTVFDYPQPGPADIYALGVPPDATVFDIRPEGPALALVDEVQRRFEQGFGDYLAVVLESLVGDDGTLEPSGIAILRQKGNLKRSDHYCAFNFQDPSRASETLYSQVKPDWPNLTIPQVLQLGNAATLERQMLFDGRRTLRRIRFSRDGELTTDEHPTDEFQDQYSGSLLDSLTALIWPNLHLELQSGSSQYKREARLLPDDPNRPGLVGLQFVRFAETESLWFDPSRDYMLMERVKTQEGVGTHTLYVVTQVEQTPSGRWYPAMADMGRYELRMLVDDNPVFDEATFRFSADEASTEKAPGQGAAPPAALLPSTRGLAGSVRDEQGRAVPQATVLLYFNRNHWGLGNRVVEQTQTDPNGRFVLAGPLAFEPGNEQDYYILFAIHPDFAFAWQNIREGQAVQACDLTLTAPVTRVMTVSDHDGNPLPGVRVWLFSAGDRTSPNPLFRDYASVPTDMGLVGGLTDANGCAVLTNLPATDCCFNATLRGYADGLAFSGQNHIRLSPGADVSGWVLADKGAPVSGAVVRFYTDWMHRYFLARTDAWGYFELTDLPAQGWDMSPWGEAQGGSGGYVITVQHPDYAAPDRKLTLTPGQRIDDFLIDVPTQTTLVRCLVLEEGTDKPVAGARIDGTNAIGSIERHSDANGVFTVRVLPGPVSLHFSSPPEGVYTLTDSLASGLNHVSFQAQGREMTVLLKTPPIAGALVSVPGRVLGPQGTPVNDVAVYAAAGRFETATVANYVRPTGADGAGRFTLKEVPAGRDLHLFTETKDHRLAAAEVIPIPENPEEMPTVELILQPTRTAEVVIQDEAGDFVADTALSILPLVQGERIWMSDAARRGRTDRLGLLQLEGVMPGLVYQVRDARFEENIRRPAGEEWFERDMILIPLEP
jgi:hypothetical protein